MKTSWYRTDPLTRINLKRKKNGSTTYSMDSTLLSDIERTNEYFPRVYETMDISETQKQKMLLNPKSVLSEKKLTTLRTIAEKRNIWKGLTRAVTTAKTIEWYDNYCTTKDIETPPRYDKRGNNLIPPRNTNNLQHQHRERKEFTPNDEGAEEDRDKNKNIQLNPRAPQTPQRLHRYQEDNPRHIDK